MSTILCIKYFPVKYNEYKQKCDVTDFTRAPWSFKRGVYGASLNGNDIYLNAWYL